MMKRIIKIFLCSIIILFVSCSKKATPTTSTTPTKTTTTKTKPPVVTKKEKTSTKAENNLKSLKVDEQIQYLKMNSTWVDSVFNSLTPEERIGQLIMFDAYSYKSKAHLDSLMSLVKNYKIGGLIFFKGGPYRQSKMINSLQKASKVPLLIAMDAEYGLGMRLDSTVKYPFQMTLGAIKDNDLIFQMGKAIAQDFKRVGMHVNFAPVLDINSNPKNPIIGIRSFGENKYNVTAKCLAYMRGLQSNGVIATAKHFPGHGDTHIDSHLDLPLVEANRMRLDTLELYPFKELMKEGLGGIMVAHMNIPALDATEKLPSTLSKPIVTGLLKKELGFKGVIFTDAMVMEGVAKYFPAGISEPLAIIAGNDVLEKMKDAKLAIKSIKAAVDKGEIKQEEIDDRCRKVLALKQWVGLNKFLPIDLNNINKDLNTAKADSLINKLIEASATMLRNKDKIIPIDEPRTLKIATLSLNATSSTRFQKTIGKYIIADPYFLPLKSTASAINKMSKSLKGYDLVLVGIHDTRSWPGYKLNYSTPMNNLIIELAKSDKAIITLFGNAYALASLEGVEEANGLLVMYENSDYTNEVAGKILLGMMKPHGRLPVTVNSYFKIDQGLME